METYIALLRGINISGQKLIKMADLKAHLSELKFTDVQTYIQSGNVIFKYENKTLEYLGNKIEQKILEKYGFEVTTIVKTPSELQSVIEQTPFLKDQKKDPNRIYITFLSEIPSSINIKKLENIDHSPEEFILKEKTIYFYSPNGYGRAKMNNNFFENKLKLKATTRNLKTVNKLLEIFIQSN